MATTADNVAVAVTGEVSFAATGSTLPTDHSTALDGAFVGLGYNDESGVSETIGESRQAITAWQNGDEVRNIRTAHTVTYDFTCIETNEAVLEAYYGDYAAGTVEIKGDMATRGCWVIEVVDGDDVTRIVIPDGEVTGRGGVSYVGTGAVAYPMTITCYPDSSGVKAYQYYGALSA